jgi:FkbM family methyltransferase
LGSKDRELSGNCDSQFTVTRRLIRAISPRWLRNWGRSPTKSISYLVGKIRFALGKVERVSVRADFAPLCHPLSRVHYELFCHDPAQISELDAFVEHCTPGMRLLDVGAHHGLFALAACRFGEPAAQILCVEASPAAAAILRKNIELNHASESVQVAVCAAGGEAGVLNMLTTGPYVADYLVPAHTGRPDAICVKTKTLSTILSETNFSPTHIKLDIEGLEFEVIHEAKAVLREYRPVLFLELHGAMMASRGCDPARVIQDLKDCGYRRFCLGERHLDEMTTAEWQGHCRLICQT